MADKGKIEYKMSHPLKRSSGVAGMWSESALSKGESSNNIRRGAILSIWSPSHTYNLFLSSFCVSHAYTNTQPFSDGNSPDVQQQGTSLGVGNHKHTNTYSPGPCLQITELSKQTKHHEYHFWNYLPTKTKILNKSRCSQHIWELERVIFQ